MIRVNCLFPMSLARSFPSPQPRSATTESLASGQRLRDRVEPDVVQPEQRLESVLGNRSRRRRNLRLRFFRRQSGQSRAGQVAPALEIAAGDQFALGVGTARHRRAKNPVERHRQKRGGRIGPVVHILVEQSVGGTAAPDKADRVHVERQHSLASIAARLRKEHDGLAEGVRPRAPDWDVSSVGSRDRSRVGGWWRWRGTRS